MSELQHQEARRLLPIIFRATQTGDMLTYQSAARKLGRDPRTNARTVEQMCDLLDAAAALARVPLLALYYVREASFAINRKALVNLGWSDAIVEKSRRHTFTNGDVDAIKAALDSLGGMGNVRAWGFVRQTLSPEELHRRLAEPEIETSFDAIDDIGSDAIGEIGSDSPIRTTVTTQQYARDPQIRLAVLLRARDRRDFCNCLGFLRDDGSRYLDAHHIIALANDGADRMTNVIALCANDHRRARFGCDRNELEQQMIQIVDHLESRRISR
jgi:HNH endonuclease